MPRKSWYVGPRRPRRYKRIPIKVPQTPERPLVLHQRDLVRPGVRGRRPYWMVVHRRGPHRPDLGGDPRELRAVPREEVTGTLPERITYKYLRDVLQEDFSFQSSLLGGRLEFGGIVADFVLEFRKIILNPFGPTHGAFIQQRKDEEQRMVLAEMGYTAYYIDENDVYDEFKFEEIMRGIFALGPRFGSSAFSRHDVDDEFTLLRLRNLFQQVLDRVRSLA